MQLMDAHFSENGEKISFFKSIRIHVDRTLTH